MTRKIKQEQEKQSVPAKLINRKMSLKSAPNSLKKIRKVVDDFINSGRKLSPADKFDLRMAKMFIEYLSESVDILLDGKNPNNTIQLNQIENNTVNDNDEKIDNDEDDDDDDDE